MKELISIVIPTYKRSEFQITRAIDSCLNQTYKNIEVIIVDDNSNELDYRNQTKMIENKYKSNNLIFLYNSENLGGALSRNNGINKSNGKYIAFLDDDDEFLPTKIEKQYLLMKEKEKVDSNVALIYCYKSIINTEGNIVMTSENINFEGKCLFEHLRNCIETTSTWFCNKEKLLNVGLFENVKAHQDNILLMKLLGNGYSIYRTPDVLLNFYLHGGNGITKKNLNYIDYTIYMHEFKKQYYNQLTKKQIEEIEYYNCDRLFELYRINNLKNKAKSELKKIIFCHKFRKHTIRLIFEFMFKWGK